MERGKGRIWPDLAGSGRIWADLAGSGRIWADLGGSGRMSSKNQNIGVNQKTL